MDTAGLSRRPRRSHGDLRFHERRQLGGQQGHWLVMVEVFTADPMKLVGRLRTADLVKEGARHALAEIVEELLHPLALDLFWLVETRLRIPQRANVAPEIAAGRLRDALAAQLLADLVEQPRAADHAAADHQPARAGPGQ